MNHAVIWRQTILYKSFIETFFVNEMIIHAGIVLKRRNEFKRNVAILENRFFISVTKEILLKIIDLNKSNIWPLQQFFAMHHWQLHSFYGLSVGMFDNETNGFQVTVDSSIACL